MPTYPTSSVHPYDHDSAGNGITMREHFAGLALQGLLSSGIHPLIPDCISSECAPPERFAEVAVEMADALIRRLNGVSARDEAAPRPDPVPDDPETVWTCRDHLAARGGVCQLGLDDVRPVVNAAPPLHRRSLLLYIATLRPDLADACRALADAM